MATYYVRQDGNDSNTGLGSTTALAWQSLDKALGATGITSGDTLWIAPGDYRRGSTLTIGGTYTSMVYIKGDPTASQFPGITAARILITSRLGSDVGTGTSSMSQIIDLNSKNFMTWENMVFEQAYLQRQIFHARTGTDLTWRNCLFLATGQQQIDAFNVTYAPSVTRNILFSRCAWTGLGAQTFWNDTIAGTPVPVANYTYNLTIDRCWGCSFYVNNSSNHTYAVQGIYIVNSYIYIQIANIRGNVVIRNSVFGSGVPYAQGASGTGILEYSSFVNQSWPYSYGSGNIDDARMVNGNSDLETRMFGIGSSHAYPNFFNLAIAQNSGTSAGTSIPTLAGLTGYSATGTPLTDFFGNAWDGNGTPHIGVFNNYSTTVTTVPYTPTAQIETTLSVLYGATSQTIYMMLGWTGLTHSSTGLTVTYTRDRSSATSITLVSQTVSGAWTSGGFCEVNATNQPGLYRLDVPNAAFLTGSNGVVIVGKGLGLGASVVNIRINYPEYLPTVRMGVFKITRMRGNRVEDNVIDVVQGSEHEIELTLEDADGTSVPISGATTEVNIADSSGTVVTAVTTPLYADGGRLSFRLSTAYTNEPGTYKVYVNRTDLEGTQIFGPLRMVVRSL